MKRIISQGNTLEGDSQLKDLKGKGLQMLIKINFKNIYGVRKSKDQHRKESRLIAFTGFWNMYEKELFRNPEYITFRTRFRKSADTKFSKRTHHSATPRPHKQTRRRVVSQWLTNKRFFAAYRLIYQYDMKAEDFGLTGLKGEALRRKYLLVTKNKNEVEFRNPDIDVILTPAGKVALAKAIIKYLPSRFTPLPLFNALMLLFSQHESYHMIKC